LERLLEQKTEGLFTYNIVVVDNDVSQSSKSIVSEYGRNSCIRISYHHEPRQNISLARNMAVGNAGGDFIAFIDDDEFPDDSWLVTLYKTLRKHEVDGVLGPVKPHFDAAPPKWILRSGVLERPSFPTGTALAARDTRTGNVMFDRKVFDSDGCPFDPRFGRIGGEDGDFFKRKIEAGGRFIWCDEACVYETVPPERLKRTYFLKRALLRGVAEAKLPSISMAGVARSLVAIFVYTSALPALLLIRHHLFMKYLIRDCDHIGKLLALCGIDVLKKRTY
jgi:glycosyltransferase involved in cell wall biosynthesis